jgi:hypothetical protein
LEHTKDKPLDQMLLDQWCITYMVAPTIDTINVTLA